MLSGLFTKTFAVSHFSKLVLIAVLALGLTSCGYHLRGNIPLSEGLKNMALNAPEGSFKDLLEKRLTNLGANLVEESAADVLLEVTSVKSDRKVGTLDERGKANSYNINLRVNYILKDTAGNAIRPSKMIRESRRYNFDPDAVVEAESEEADLIEDMEEEAVLKLIRRLSSITDFDPSAVENKAASESSE
ncbi:MAG: LPS assembly lipoprotein LptE [Gammaproteobacteria bacterium]|nr:LPS assembly lipoprotein LptE [Gammaproteobacteria bacterium]